MGGQDRRLGHRMVRHPFRIACRSAHLTLPGTSTSTFALDTSSSCRTTGRVTRYACLVGGVFPPNEVIDHITIRILPRRLHCSCIGRISVQGMSSDPNRRRSRRLMITYRSGCSPGTTRSRSLLHIDSTNGRTRSDVNLQQATSEPSAPQLRSISSEYGARPQHSPSWYWPAL